ncbi:hypothetical protein K435DRAFT_796601 [Dendrothele bispora CBS 962.96]|uniref:Uncharacterized protein n=1 Tax=Dendrothele bispora (strain CBS 962.96) TaxID=1314807 RepID=A0A4S8M6A3_DENBC|nr:hypothetical protein K435DRAFT_796601 [Dendrothele bispora CBS 962.96]
MNRNYNHGSTTTPNACVSEYKPVCPFGNAPETSESTGKTEEDEEGDEDDTLAILLVSLTGWKLMNKLQLGTFHFPFQVCKFPQPSPHRTTTKYELRNGLEGVILAPSTS